MADFYDCELLDVVTAYERLLRVEYTYTLKSKTKGKREVYLRFVTANFYHLAGFQHFTDVTKLKLYHENAKPASHIIEEIKSGNITAADIKNSAFFDNRAAKRIFYLRKFEEILDKSNKLFRFNGIISGKGHDGSERVYRSYVRADYILKHIENSDMVFSFFASKNTKNGLDSILQPVSLFVPADDFSRGQNEQCMLVKKKIFHGEETTEKILYIHPAYLRTHPEFLETDAKLAEKV